MNQALKQLYIAMLSPKIAEIIRGENSIIVIVRQRSWPKVYRFIMGKQMTYCLHDNLVTIPGSRCTCGEEKDFWFWKHMRKHHTCPEEPNCKKEDPQQLCHGCQSSFEKDSAGKWVYRKPPYL